MVWIWWGGAQQREEAWRRSGRRGAERKEKDSDDVKGREKKAEAEKKLKWGENTPCRKELQGKGDGEGVGEGGESTPGWLGIDSDAGQPAAAGASLVGKVESDRSSPRLDPIWPGQLKALVMVYLSQNIRTETA